MTRRIIKEGEDLIREFEGLRLDAYQCAAGVWTCGIGETGSDVRKGVTWTAAYAEERFQRRLRIVEEQVEKMLLGAHVPDSVFAVLVSMTFNCGADAISKSTLVRKVRKGDLLGAYSEIPKWCHSKGQLIAGLVRRRAAEQKLWQDYRHRKNR
jgi:lysozyme